MVLESAGWDRKEFSESNLHVCGRGDTKTGIYNMERCTKKRRGRKIKGLSKIRTVTLVQFDCSTKLCDTNYLGYSEDRFSNLTCVLQF